MVDPPARAVPTQLFGRENSRPVCPWQ